MTIKEKFALAIKSRQRVWSHNRNDWLGASETFTCLRRAYLIRNSTDHAEMSLGAAERGNVMEKHFVVPCLQQIFGTENVLYASDDQESFKFIQNSVTPDALIVNVARDFFADDGLPDLEADCFVAEIKSFDPRKTVLEAEYQHAGQAQIQLHGFNTLTKYRPVWAVIFYVNASFYDDVRVFFVRYDPAVFEQAVERAKLLYETKDASDLLPEGVYLGTCGYCPVAHLCNDADVKSVSEFRKPVDVAVLPELESFLMQGLVVREDMKALKKAKEENDHAIRQLLKAQGTNHGEIDEATVTVSVEDGKESLDKDALDSFLRQHNKTTKDFRKTGADFTKLLITRKRKRKPKDTT